MFFSLAAVAIFVAVAFFQSSHGIFSNFIMAVLTILCAAIAFGTHEIIFYNFLIPYLPNYGQALSLAVMFAVPLFLLRVFFDARFGGNMEMPVQLDRIGGAALGLVTATICTGIILICFQLLPFDVEIMGYRRMVDGQRKNVWLNPDGMTVRLVSAISDGSLGSTKHFSRQHPDYLIELHAGRTIQRESLHIVPENTFSIQRVWRLPEKGVLQRDPRKELVGIPAGYIDASASKWWAVRVSISETAAQDSDHRYRYTGYSWRLVGTTKDGEPRQLFAAAVKRVGDTAETGKFVLFDTKDRNEYEARTTEDAPFQELAFAVPAGFKPEFLEFKRSARVALTEVMVEGGAKPAAQAHSPAPRPAAHAAKPASTPPKKVVATSSPPQPKPTAPSEPEKTSAQKPDKPTEVEMNKGGQGRLASRSAFKAERSDEIPVFLSRSVYSGGGASVNNIYLRSGHVDAEIPAKRKIKVGTVQKFQSLPGVKVIQIHTDPVKALSAYGKALSFADRTLAQYRLTDSTGETHWPIGEVRIAKIGGKEHVEIQYHSEVLLGQGIPERALTAAKKIKENDLYQEGAEVIFIFLVPEDAQIRSFKSARWSYDIPGGI